MNIIVGTDNNYGVTVDRECANAFISKVEAAGHKCTYVGRGPNVVQAYAQTHECDIMVQIAAGKCLGTFADFVNGCRGTNYKAEKFSIPYWKNEESVMTWKAHRSSDDNFSWGMDLSNYIGKTLPTLYEEYKDVAIFSHGNTGEEMANMFLKNLGGGGTSDSNSTNSGGGSTALDLIKQVVSDWDDYGVTIALEGAKVKIGRATTRPVYDKESYQVNAPIIKEDVVVNDTLTFTDWNPSTTNWVYNKKGAFEIEGLVKRFGKKQKQVPENTSKTCSEETWLEDMMTVSNRDSGRVVELTILPDPCVYVNSYVYLSLGSVGLYGFYFVHRLSLTDEQSMQLTLERAPPSRYQEKQSTESVETEQKSNSKDMISIGNNLAAKYGFCALLARDKGAKGYVTSNYADMKKSGCGDCHAWSDALYTELNAVGIKTRIIQYNNGYVGNHRSVQIYQNGQWVDYPYKQTNISNLASAQSYKGGMYVWRNAP